MADQFPQLYLEKGDDAPAEHVLAFADPDGRQEFLRKCKGFVGRLRETFN